jgi:uncharacterized protein (TIGR03437 family)
VSVRASSDQGFSATQGANNWYYGYFPSGNVNTFMQLPTFDGPDQRWEHNTFGPPWTVVAAGSGFHPNGADNGTEEWATRRWVSNVSGAVQIAGHLAKIDTDPASTGVFGRIYLNHKLIYEHFVAGTDGIGVNYSVTAALNAGDILDFSVAPNGSNVANDSTVFSASIILTTAPVSPGSGPSIGAVSNSASGQADMAPGTFVSIYGSNFASAGFVDDWSKSVIAGKLPTQLDGVTVSIGGHAAYIVAVTSNQINVLTPSLGTGSVPVTVTTTAGTSGSFATAIQTVEPGLFAWPGNQVVATHLDYSFAVQNGTFSVTTVPAKPGEAIILWGTGFGVTIPAAPDGQVVPPGHPYRERRHRDCGRTASHRPGDCADFGFGGRLPDRHSVTGKSPQRRLPCGTNRGWSTVAVKRSHHGAEIETFEGRGQGNPHVQTRFTVERLTGTYPTS